MSVEEQLMLWDLIFYLPNDILTKVDRASMAFSLETRAPFLDHKLIEYSLNLNKSLKIRNGSNKWILKEILYKYHPQKYFNRPKSGFSIPLKSWLDGPLHDWSKDLLNINKIKKQGYLNVNTLNKIIELDKSGKYNLQHGIWNILMFQSWLEKQ